MVQPPKTVKRAVKVLVNGLGVLLSVILLVLVAATQQGYGADFGIGGGIAPGSCLLNVPGSFGVCAYAYVLAGLSILLSLVVIVLALVACATNNDAPVIADFSIHAVQTVWWLIGVAVLGTFVSRANSLRYQGEGPRVAIVLVAVANFLLFLTSLWTNACCCIARYKNENVSMYV